MGFEGFSPLQRHLRAKGTVALNCVMSVAEVELLEKRAIPTAPKALSSVAIPTSQFIRCPRAAVIGSSR